MLTKKRQLYRQGLSVLYTPHYDALCAGLPEEWMPYFGLRTFAEQDALFAKGRSAPGPVVTNARGGESAHCYGAATDWTLWVGGTPVWMKGSDPRWQVYLDAVKRAGLRSGSTFPSPDYPHAELPIDCSWRNVAGVYAVGGMLAAQRHIEANQPRV